MMTEKEYNKALALLGANKCLDDSTAQNFISVVETMERMMDDADCEDAFGTQGWRYHLGWD